MNKQIKYIISGCIAVVVIGGMFYWKDFISANTPAAQATVERRVSVRVTPVQQVEKMSSLVVKGTLEPVNEGIVSGKVAGKVIKVLFENGQQVTAGSPLVVIDDQDIQNQLRSAQVTVQKLTAILNSTQRDYNRSKLLLGQGAISQQEMDGAQTALDNAKADLASAKVNVASLEDNLGNTVIRAPLSGIIDEKNIVLGQMANPGEVLAKVKDVSAIYAVSEIRQDAVKYLNVGGKAKVSLQNQTAKSFEGTIKNITPSADPATRVFQCKILLSNPQQELYPGMFAKVEIPTNQNYQSLVLPVAVVAGTEDNYAVFVAEQGRARKREVTVGEINQNLIEIKTGLKKGDQVISTNLNTLQDGDLIELVTGQGE